MHAFMKRCVHAHACVCACVYASVCLCVGMCRLVQVPENPGALHLSGTGITEGCEPPYVGAGN